MRLPVRRAVLSKDVGQLQSWLGQGLLLAFASVGASGVTLQVIQRTDGGGHDLWAHLGVTRSGIDAAMTEQDLNHADVVASSKRWVAKQWRRVWTVTLLRMPESAAASRHASCKEPGHRWRVERPKYRANPAT